MKLFKQQIQHLINQQSHKETLLKQSNDIVNSFQRQLREAETKSSTNIGSIIIAIIIGLILGLVWGNK